jgi:hypothetical protein
MLHAFVTLNEAKTFLSSLLVSMRKVLGSIQELCNFFLTESSKDMKEYSSIYQDMKEYWQGGWSATLPILLLTLQANEYEQIGIQTPKENPLIGIQSQVNRYQYNHK